METEGTGQLGHGLVPGIVQDINGIRRIGQLTHCGQGGINDFERFTAAGDQDVDRIGPVRGQPFRPVKTQTPDIQGKEAQEQVGGGFRGQKQAGGEVVETPGLAAEPEQIEGAAQEGQEAEKMGFETTRAVLPVLIAAIRQTPPPISPENFHNINPGRLRVGFR